MRRVNVCALLQPRRDCMQTTDCPLVSALHLPSGRKQLKFCYVVFDSATVFYDKILILGVSQEEHDARLRRLLQQFQETDFHLWHEKCCITQEEVSYIGYTLSAEGLSQAWTRQMRWRMRGLYDVSTLRSFLGQVNFFWSIQTHVTSSPSALERECWLHLVWWVQAGISAGKELP